MADPRLMEAIDRMGYAGAEGLALADGSSVQTESVALSYGDFLSSARADAAYAISGMPQIYFKWLDEINAEAGRAWHHLAWNRGDAPVLCLVSGDVVYLYNSYAHPSKLEGDEREQEHSGALLSILSLTDETLRDTYGRVCFDTGSFWQTTPGMKITARERVDSQLLKDIADARNLLVGEQLTLQTAQALLGRAIFLSYLTDRGVLSPDFLRERFGQDVLAGIFTDQTSAIALFRWMAEAFNGDLFPLEDHETAALKTQHWGVLERFLSGEQMGTGQRRLWPYDFATIPVELISSLYEMFTREDEPAGQNTATGQEQPVQNKTGVHYTPPLLVRSIVEEAMRGLDDSALVLDPACGSGAFLVEVFRRLAFRRRERTGVAPTFAELSRILTGQVFGLEISLDAGRIAAFSLYLALLENACEVPCAADIRLPHLEGISLFSGMDAFDEDAVYNARWPFASCEFDLVVGNPPWTQSREHCASASAYCNKRGLPLDNNQPYHAFLWRAQQLGRDGSRIAMMVPALMLFQPRGRRTVERLLSECSNLHVVNLMHLRDAEIFRGVTAPPAVVLCENGPPTEDATVRYDAPKVSRAVDTTKQVVILDDDKVNLPLDLIRHDHSIWKASFWGSAADWNLLQHLREQPTLEQLADGRGWQRGAGCGIFNLDRKPLSKRRDQGAPPPPSFVGRPLLREEDIPPYGSSLVLSAVQETDRADRWRDKKTPHLFLGPQLLVGRSPKEDRITAAYVPSGVVFSPRYWGLSLGETDEQLGQYLSVLLNSDVAQYFLFLTSSRWGVERDDVLPSEIAALPVPEWHDLTAQQRGRICELETLLRHGHDTADALPAHEELQRLVAEVYRLTARESDFVDEVVTSTISFFRESKKASFAPEPPNAQDLDAYAAVLAASLNPYLEPSGRQAAITIWCGDSDPLQVIQLVETSLVEQDARVVQHKDVPGSVVLRSLSRTLHHQVDANLAVRRNIRVYDPGSGLLIIKRAEKRYWTKAAAHRDAGAVISDHL
ncbi:SAM-dependent methyltransferase [bacterium]|nr:SAM-dependent methyltransferase [bacterium]